RLGGERSLRDRAKPLHHFGRAAAKILEISGKIFARLGPIVDHDASFFRPRVKANICRHANFSIRECRPAVSPEQARPRL
ncbi:MAG: hypothetical protein ACK5JM_10180, partial [Rhodoblastus sp.]